MLATTTSLIQSIVHLPFDWVIVFALFVGFAFDGYQSGAARASAAAVAFPLAIFLSNMAAGAFAIGATLHNFQHAPHADLYPAAIIAALFVALYLVIGRMIEPSLGAGGLISALLAGLGGIAVFCALWVSTPAFGVLFQFGPFIQLTFSEAYRLYWLFGGYVVLAFARG